MQPTQSSREDCGAYSSVLGQAIRSSGGVCYVSGSVLGQSATLEGRVMLSPSHTHIAKWYPIFYARYEYWKEQADAATSIKRFLFCMNRQDWWQYKARNIASHLTQEVYSVYRKV